MRTILNLIRPLMMLVSLRHSTQFVPPHVQEQIHERRVKRETDRIIGDLTDEYIKTRPYSPNAGRLTGVYRKLLQYVQDTNLTEESRAAGIRWLSETVFGTGRREHQKDCELIETFLSNSVDPN